MLQGSYQPEYCDRIFILTMQKQFTKQYMQDNCGCYSQEQLSACSFMRNETIALIDIVNSEIALNDKFWFICKKVLTKEQNRQLAIDVAEIVLPIFETNRPSDIRPREAIEAAKLFIAGCISLEQLREKRNAADAYAAAAAATHKKKLLEYLINLVNTSE